MRAGPCSRMRRTGDQAKRVHLYALKLRVPISRLGVRLRSRLSTPTHLPVVLPHASRRYIRHRLFGTCGDRTTLTAPLRSATKKYRWRASQNQLGYQFGGVIELPASLIKRLVAERCEVTSEYSSAHSVSEQLPQSLVRLRPCRETIGRMKSGARSREK